MTPQVTLYTHRGPGPNPLKSAALLEKLDLSYDVIPLDFSDDKSKGVKGEDFLKINPNGRVPALIDHQNKDFVVWESGAILFYLSEKYDKNGTFSGKGVDEKAITMQWLTHQLSGLGPTQGNVNYLHHYWEATYGEKPSKSAFTRFEGESHRLYKILDDQLGRQSQRGSQFIALDRLTIADIAFWTWVRIAGFGKLDISGYKNVQKWLQTLEADQDLQNADKKLPKS